MPRNGDPPQGRTENLLIKSYLETMFRRGVCPTVLEQILARIKRNGLSGQQFHRNFVSVRTFYSNCDRSGIYNPDRSPSFVRVVKAP